MFDICLEAFLDVREASQMSESVRKALPDVRKTHSDALEWSGDHPGCP